MITSDTQSDRDTDSQLVNQTDIHTQKLKAGHRNLLSSSSAALLTCVTIGRQVCDRVTDLEVEALA
eukprot:COSAG06_NODE_606_length_13867_cov_16.158701_14_plen_66_part_00